MPVYFMQCVDGGPIKIGTTIRLSQRLKQLEGHYGRELAVLATMPGGRAEEAEIHGRFAHLRFGRTEQFRPDAELMAFIGRPLLVGPNPDAVEEMDPMRDDVSVRVELTPGAHRLLRLVAADEDVSMAAFARDKLIELLKDEARKRGIKS